MFLPIVGRAQSSCYLIKLNNPAAQDGMYTIDPDGPGGNAPLRG